MYVIVLRVFLSFIFFFSNLCTCLLYLDSHSGRGVVLWVFSYPLAIAPFALGLCQRMHSPHPQSSVAAKGLHICLFIPCFVAINRTPLLAGVVLVFDYFLRDGEGLQNSCQKSHILSKILLSMWSKSSPFVKELWKVMGKLCGFFFSKNYFPTYLERHD